jgi:hypothetical protein
MTAANRNYLLGGVAAVVIVVGGVFAFRHTAPPATRPAAAPHTAPVPPAPVQPTPVQPASAQTPPVASSSAAAPPGAATPPAAPISPCPVPQTVPPSAPDGATATAQEMKDGHDRSQAYVNQLEAYQACLNHLADLPGIAPAQRQAWIDQGNGAVDEANLLAQAFSLQLQAYHAKHPGQ